MMSVITFSIPCGSAEDQKKAISALPFGEAECARLNSMRDDSSRALSLSALMALKEAVSLYGIVGEDLSIIRTELRKPYFAHLDCHFSLSHTDGIAVSALSFHPIGIDIEWLDYSRDVSRLSGRFFTEAEQCFVEKSKDKVFAFYSLWTKKEAFAKLTGEGLAAVCSGKDMTSTVFSQYLAELYGKRAIITVASLYAEEINSLKIHNPYKELKLYEI